MSEFVDLQRLLTAGRAPDQLLAVRGAERITRTQWLERVRQWHALMADCPGDTWALYHSDAAEFSAILFALWACGKTACVPGSNQPVVVEQLAARVDGFLGEFNTTGTSLPFRSEPPGSAASSPPTFDTLDTDRRVLEVFTSGSSGRPQAIAKRLSQLASEVAGLESIWGATLGDAAIMATVSHHHIYGLLFRVLWPLAAGRCFDARACEYFQQISARGRDWSRVAVISSPAHLSRFPRETHCEILLKRCCTIFSSGAPLPREASLRVRRLLGFSPVEVYGSSETGGIAYRRQTPERDDRWRPLPRVSVSIDSGSGCLRVRSPYLPPMPDGAWHTTADKAQLSADGRFQLQGRMDRVVKIEGKRVSLNEMEQRLRQHAWIDDARLVVLEGRRTELGAVIAVTDRGRRALAGKVRRRVNIELQKHLHRQFERTVIPRRWRYVESLPVNSEGKTTQPALLQLFDDTTAPRADAGPDLAKVVNR